MFVAPSYALAPAVTPRWTLVTPGADLAIDLDTVKDFIHRPREDTFWDDQITSFIKIATNALEQHLRITLVESTWKATLPYFTPQIRINKRPFIGVTKIEYVEKTEGQILEVDTDLYHALPITSECGMVFLGDGQAWPECAKRWDAVRITVQAGFETLPDDIEHALLMTIASIDSKRGDERESGGSNVTVYAMKNARGGSLIPAEAAALVNNWKLQLLSVA